ncbi:50S ribosomal protein L3 N(5)-glutamine methyltransferase [Opitutus sp. ER46]|uniref:50S ribosomal protein L3 N(5)-glutamine methyltransferase n=1 Tax=Opitutus sp. ER46 TaxID=2161864 RepID=UPI000D2FAF0A|nr:50S ribosomal protein L3 N(5)-glutamine methyltransferase [Opitutus sp. ER46]PTX91482.1 50S ribosomal protein L3 N(5)-glutamine methyltransferase [Opitutus sp. ER46]
MPTSSRRKTRPATDPFAGAAALETPGAWLAFAEKLLEERGVALGQVATDAHDEALYLILRTLGFELDVPVSVLRRRLTPAQRASLEAVFCRRVIERVPAAYLTREAWLGEHRFYVDERVIIPRSYFLELIPGQLGEWLPEGGANVRHAVDVCTGSGCLAILLAHQFPSARVDACDLSADALAVAKRNVHEHGVASRVHLYQSDVLDAVPPAKYDIILSNPPYEPSGLVDQQTPEFAAEPRMAHDGGADGLVVIRKLLRQARARLQPHGIVVIEVGGLREAIDREFGKLQPQWLPTADGTDCVVLFQAHRLGEG